MFEEITPEILDNMSEDSAEYTEFVEKFKPKKTTDDCYTPPNIYDAVASWIEKEYNVSRADFVRPFYPGGDYETFEYPSDCIVVDNPPFSILKKIVRFYIQHDIKFFLFSPALTILSNIGGVCAICVKCDVEYDNGAVVHTSFLTNLETCIARSAPDLYKLVNSANEENRKLNHKKFQKYIYPEHLITAAMINRYSRYGIDFRIEQGDAYFVRRLESQIPHNKAIYGAGLLVSEKIAAEKSAAEKSAAEKSAAEKSAAEKSAVKDAMIWELSDRERKIIANLRN